MLLLSVKQQYESWGLLSAVGVCWGSCSGAVRGTEQGFLLRWGTVMVCKCHCFRGTVTDQQGLMTAISEQFM